MRTRSPGNARNFAQVISSGYSRGPALDCRGTQAAFGDKNPKCFEAVALKDDKYQALNGQNPAFFLEPERYKGTS